MPTISRATKQIVGALTVFLAGSACGERPVDDQGIVLADVATEEIPNQLKFRSILHGALVNPSDVNRFPGIVLTFFGTRQSNGDCQVDTARPPQLSTRRYVAGATPLEITPISHIWYSAIVTSAKGIAAEYLGSGGNVSDSSRAELVIEDVASSVVPDARLDRGGLRQLANAALPAGACKRVVVLAAYLTSAKSRSFKVASANANVAAVAVKVDGKYYTSAEQYRSNLLLAVDARSFDDLAALTAGDSLPKLTIVSGVRFRAPPFVNITPNP